MRFRKSISICKGVKLNFSKSGVSATVGTKGISANVGKQGLYVNTSLPGTGIYDRKRLVNFNNLDLSGLNIGSLNVGELLGVGKKPAAKKPAGKTPVEVPDDITLSLSDEGEIQVFDAEGNLVDNKTVLSKLKASDNYKTAAAQLLSQAVEAANAETSAFVNIGHMSADVPRADQYEKLISTSKPVLYEPQPFDEPEPTREAIRARLEKEAQEKVQSFLGINLEKKRLDYVNDRLADAYLDEHEVWEKRKKAFDTEQQQTVDTMNAQLLEDHQARMEMLQRGMNGDRDEIEDSIETWLNSLEMPIEFDVEFEYDEDEGLLMADMDLPEIEDLPTEKTVEMSSGKLKVMKKTQKELREEYLKCVLGLGMYCASNFFCLSPHMDYVLMSAYTQRRDAKSGDMKNEYIYSVLYERNDFERPGYQKKEPVDFFGKCKKSRMNLMASGLMKEITPFGPADMEK